MKNTERKIIRFIFISFIFNMISLIVIPYLISAADHLFCDHILKTPGEEYRVDTPENVDVYINSEGSVKNIDFEDYVKGVVASEMPSSFRPEALKAQAVAARTYAASKIIRSGDGGFPEAHPSAPLCDSVHCQAYKDVSSLARIKGALWMKNEWPKICRAVDSTKGEMMYYNGELVSQALFHSSSGGRTENSEDVFVSAVPYLRSVSSDYEKDASHKNEKTVLSFAELASALNSNFPDRFTGDLTQDDINIKNRTAGGRVGKIRVGNAVYTGSEMRKALSLASANFSIDINAGRICFTTSGYGHGVGMSQYGANGMAGKGYDYKSILEHYYTGIRIM